MLAYCYANGSIGYSEKECPVGALPIAEHSDIQRIIERHCTFSENTKEPIIPGFEKSQQNLDKIGTLLGFQMVIQSEIVNTF